ncbi:hypothetical protein Anas_07561 [Armadillidium nasatum]|uniref:C-type lectin domain-containing protein n=1 Tax=Armadillidium nasatum TaxID=96803 RepID=A0A5N5T0Z2_9CRUS|nr:hypothetical protein Anas_07561 [Armadillidium nasatum]
MVGLGKEVSGWVKSPSNIFLLLIFISTSQCFYFIPILHFNYGNAGLFANEGRSYLNQGGPLYEKIYPKSLSSDLDPRFIHKKLTSFQVGLRSFFHEGDLNEYSNWFWYIYKSIVIGFGMSTQSILVGFGIYRVYLLILQLVLGWEESSSMESVMITFRVFQTFDDAQHFCSENRGHIWTPNFDDIFLFNKIRIVLPDFTAAPKNGVWIGAKVMNGVILDVNGNEETGSQFFQIDNQGPQIIF